MSWIGKGYLNVQGRQRLPKVLMYAMGTLRFKTGKGYLKVQRRKGVHKSPR